MRILVTGGAGYIGSHVVYELGKAGHEVIVVDTMEKGNHTNLFPQNQFIKADIANNDILEFVFSKGIDAVFHFAAWKAAGESMTSPEKYSLNNLNGTMKLLAKMSSAGCKKIVFSSSAAVYGEPQYLPIDEKHPLKPINYYGFTKLSIEQNLEWYDKLKGIKFAALRYFNAAGYHPAGKILGLEKDPANLLPIIMETAVGIRPKFDIFGDNYPTPDGTCIRDYIHVTDLAIAHVLALNYITANFQSITVNLGSEKGYSVKEILDSAERVSKKKIPHSIVGKREGDPAELRASSEQARMLLNWSPQYSDPDTLVSTTYHVYLQNIRK